MIEFQVSALVIELLRLKTNSHIYDQRRSETVISVNWNQIKRKAIWSVTEYQKCLRIVLYSNEHFKSKGERANSF